MLNRFNSCDLQWQNETRLQKNRRILILIQICVQISPETPSTTPVAKMENHRPDLPLKAAEAPEHPSIYSILYIQKYISINILLTDTLV